MNTVKTLIAAVLAAVLLNGFATTVSAAGAEAEANSEVVCETGTYGQNVNCKAKSNAKAKVITREGVPVHKPAETGLDGAGIAAIAGTLVTGAAATVARFRMSK